MELKPHPGTSPDKMLCQEYPPQANQGDNNIHYNNHFFKIYLANSYIPITTPSSKPIINQKFSLSLYLSNQYPPNPNRANAPKIE